MQIHDSKTTSMKNNIEMYHFIYTLWECSYFVMMVNIATKGPPQKSRF